MSKNLSVIITLEAYMDTETGKPDIQMDLYVPSDMPQELAQRIAVFVIEQAGKELQPVFDSGNYEVVHHHEEESAND